MRYDTATDGVLLLRVLFGLRDAAQIEAYIAAKLPRFDVDGDNQLLVVLTD